MNNDTPDVLIIGAGATGSAVAWSLSQANISVMCLDQGDWVNPSQYHTSETDWELSRWSDFHPDPNHRSLSADYPINNDDSPISPLMYNAVGGSTIHWGAHFPRFHPSDFKTKTLDDIGSDWPFTYKDLEPYYKLNDKMMGVDHWVLSANFELTLPKIPGTPFMDLAIAPNSSPYIDFGLKKSFGPLMIIVPLYQSWEGEEPFIKNTDWLLDRIRFSA